MTVVYRMERDRRAVAQVVVLDSGKCVVSWPSSVTVYDSEQDARDVHIDHMGERGAKTKFVPLMSDESGFERGMAECVQDSCEGGVGLCMLNGLPLGSAIPHNVAPSHIPDEERLGWMRGYEAVALCIDPLWRLATDDARRKEARP